MGWFGKKEAVDVVKGIGGWIDEQQLTPEEQIKYKMHLLEKMEPFKIVQRIIVTWVMRVWALFALNFLLAWWIGVAFDSWIPFDKFVEIVGQPFIWTPCLGVFTLYLGGGLKGFFGKK